MDDNQENPSQDLKQDETVSKAETNEIQELDLKFIIIGGNEPSVNESFIKTLNDHKFPITVFEMTVEEMKFIIHSRAQKKAEETSVAFLNEEANKNRIDGWVLLLIKNHLEKMHHGKPKDLEFYLKRALDGEDEVFFTKKNLKQASGLSWSQFEELFRNLELFGVVKYCNDENPDLFSLLVNNEDILKNHFHELKQFLNITIGKVMILLKEKIEPIQKKNLESIRKTLLKASEKL